MRDCCPTPEGGEHEVTCSQYEPPLTHEEIRQLRYLIAKTSGHSD